VRVRQNPVTPFLARWRIHGASVKKADRDEDGSLAGESQAVSQFARYHQRCDHTVENAIACCQL
jgi:hypothetical protein